MQHFTTGTWAGMPIWSCTRCTATLFSEDEAAQHWSGEHVKEQPAPEPTGILDPKGREIYRQREAEVETWRDGILRRREEQRLAAEQAEDEALDQLLDDTADEIVAAVFEQEDDGEE